MYGAILGDMIGAPYEFGRGSKATVFPLFGAMSQFTDDTVMTIAVAEALLDAQEAGAEVWSDDDAIRALLTASLRKWGRRYPNAGYGFRFGHWLEQPGAGPYNSYGNGSAMRVSAAGWLASDLAEARRLARISAEVTHNHPEGIKGAESVASVIWLARSGASKDKLQEMVVRDFGYGLSRTCDEIRPQYKHVESCQETVPEAITCFLEGADFEETVRLAGSLGGDADTLACIAGSMAEAWCGVPEELRMECRRRLDEELLAVVDRFDAAVGRA